MVFLYNHIQPGDGPEQVRAAFRTFWGDGSKIEPDPNHETGAERARNLFALLPLIDPSKDTLTGRWLCREGELQAQGEAYFEIIEIPYQPPEEYDFHVEFTRLSSNNRGSPLGLILTKGGRSFTWNAAASNRWFGFDTVQGQGKEWDTKGNIALIARWPAGVALPDAVQNGRRNTVEVRVRRGGLRALLDGHIVNELVTDGSNLSNPTRLRGRDDRSLGLWTQDGVRVVFHRIEVVEVSGAGTFTRHHGAPIGIRNAK